MAGDIDLGDDAGDLAILIDRQGGMRMLDPKGWSLPALCAEYGAAAAYIVERRSRTVRVEGWGGGERCLIQRDLRAARYYGPHLGEPGLEICKKYRDVVYGFAVPPGLTQTCRDRAFS